MEFKKLPKDFKLPDFLTKQQQKDIIKAIKKGTPIIIISGKQGPSGKTTLTRMLRGYGIKAYEEWECTKITLNKILPIAKDVQPMIDKYPDCKYCCCSDCLNNCKECRDCEEGICGPGYCSDYDPKGGMTMKYIDEKGRQIFVGSGLGGALFMTMYWDSGKWNTSGMHRLKSKELPLRDTMEEAQVDLDKYAKKKGWKEVQA